jgi:serine/threonine-protein kinase
VVFSRPDPQTGNRDVWYIEIARGITARLTTHAANDWNAVWSPDGRQLAFGSDRDGGPELRPYLKTSMDPGSSESRLFAQPGTPHDWSADGRWLAYERSGDLLVGSASGSVEPFAFLTTPAFESSPRFSPDSRWIAYSSNESGRPEVYIRPFAGEPAGPTGKIQISHDGGQYGFWAPSGREIFYLSADRSVFSIDTRNLGRSETLPAAVRLFRACPSTVPSTGVPAFDTHDGQRFLVLCQTEPPGRFTVLMDWTSP